MHQTERERENKILRPTSSVFLLAFFFNLSRDINNQTWLYPPSFLLLSREEEKKNF
jgi:hypothetical protein